MCRMVRGLLCDVETHRSINEYRSSGRTVEKVAATREPRQRNKVADALKSAEVYTAFLCGRPLVH